MFKRLRKKRKAAGRRSALLDGVNMGLHHMPKGQPAVRAYTKPSVEAEADREICERLLLAFRLAHSEEGALPDGERASGSVWDGVKDRFHGPLYALLEAGDVGKLATQLANVLRSEAAFGLGAGQDIFKNIAKPEKAWKVTSLIVDRMVGLAEALAVLPLENPEQGRFGENIYLDLAALCRDLEKQLGCDVFMPEIAGVFGIEVDGRPLALRSADHLYTAWRLHRLYPASASPSVCEIGAGYGGTACYYRRMGGGRYTIIDLPLMNVIQGYWLGRALGPERVCLNGEPPRADSVAILPYWKIRELPDQSQDICFNQDSLPEMAEPVARGYVEQIARLASQRFYSINQEAEGTGWGSPQLRIPAMLAGDPRFRRLERGLYWLRKGYAEEVYALDATAPAQD